MGKIIQRLDNTPDYKKIKQYYEEAATNYNYPEAQCELGKLYFEDKIYPE